MLSFGFIIRLKCPFFAMTEIAHTTNVLHNIYVPAALQAPMATALNSTLTMLMVEYAGRSNLSGILKVELYELANLPIPNPYAVPPAPPSALSSPDHALIVRDRRSPTGYRPSLSDARRAIDARAFAALGLTAVERQAVYGAAYRAILTRQRAEAAVSGAR